MDNPAASFDVECSIHMGPLEEPRALPCGHEFCRSCLIFLRTRSRKFRRGSSLSSGCKLAHQDEPVTILCPICRQPATALEIDQVPGNKQPDFCQTNGTKPELCVPDGKSALQRRLSKGHQLLMEKMSLRRVPSANAGSLIESTQQELTSIEKLCDEAVENLENMISEMLAMKASTVQKRTTLPDIDCVKDPKSPRGVSIQDSCEFLLKSTQMLRNELFLEFNNYLARFFNAINIYRDMDLPVFQLDTSLSYRSAEIFKFASSLSLGVTMGDYASFSSSLVKYLQSTSPASPKVNTLSPTVFEDSVFWSSKVDQDNTKNADCESSAPDRQSIWVITSGRKGTFWSSHPDYLWLDLGGSLVAGCQCCRRGQQIPVNKDEMEQFVNDIVQKSFPKRSSSPSSSFVVKCDTHVMIKQDIASSEILNGSNLAALMKDSLENETRMNWHCVVGYKDQFVSCFGHSIVSPFTVDVDDFRVVLWQG